MDFGGFIGMLKGLVPSRPAPVVAESADAPQPATLPVIGYYDDALGLVLGDEGGFANVKNDHGGPTNYGVTQAVYDLYRDRIGEFRRDVREIERDEVHDLYLTIFWQPNAMQRFTRKLAMCCFDACINHRPKVWAKLLQRAVDVDDDGDVGSETMAAVEAMAESDVISAYLDERKKFYYAIVANDETQREFLNSWMNRITHLRAVLT